MIDHAQKIIDSAITLFNNKGFRGVGVNEIIAHARTTKRTFYHHFASKDELILRVLAQFEKQMSQRVTDRVTSITTGSTDQILGVFDLMYEWFLEEDFMGCMFNNALGQFSEGQDFILPVAQAYKKSVENIIRDILESSPKTYYPSTASQILIVLEGSITVARFTRSPETAIQAKSLIARILD